MKAVEDKRKEEKQIGMGEGLEMNMIKDKINR